MSENENPIKAALHERLFHERIVVLDEELRDDNGMEILTRLFLLSREDPHRDVTFWINSPGGSVPMMLAIGDAMQTIPNDVVTVGLGWAASAGQFLLMLGTPGKRLLMPHARVLLHQGSAGIGGSAADIELQAGDLRASRDLVTGIIARATGQSEETILADSARDRWFDAEGAIAYGFADRLVSGLGDLSTAEAQSLGGFAPGHRDLASQGGATRPDVTPTSEEQP